jgi:hypothetical protein
LSVGHCAATAGWLPPESLFARRSGEERIVAGDREVRIETTDESGVVLASVGEPWWGGAAW